MLKHYHAYVQVCDHRIYFEASAKSSDKQEIVYSKPCQMSENGPCNSFNKSCQDWLII